MSHFGIWTKFLKDSKKPSHDGKTCLNFYSIISFPVLDSWVSCYHLNSSWEVRRKMLRNLLWLKQPPLGTTINHWSQSRGNFLMRSNEWKWLTESKKLRYDDIFRRTISLCQVFSLKFFFFSFFLAFMYESSILFFLQLARKSNCLKPRGEGKCLQFTKLKTLKI